MPFSDPNRKRAYDKKYYASHHYQVTGETPTHFEVQHSNGSLFKVAKSGLSNMMHEKIRAAMAEKIPDPMALGAVKPTQPKIAHGPSHSSMYEETQHFADGDVVRPEGPTAEEVQAAVSDPETHPSVTSAFDKNAIFGDVADAAKRSVGPGLQTVSDAIASTPPYQFAKGVVGAAKDFADKNVFVDAKKLQDQKEAEAAAPKSSSDKQSLEDETKKYENALSTIPEVKPQAGGAQTDAVQAEIDRLQKMTPYVPVPEYKHLTGGDTSATDKAAAEAIQARGSIDQQMHAEMAGIADASAKAQQQSLADSQARLEQRRQEADRQRQAIAESKVDPNRLYSQMSTGDRVMSAIGLALGTYGSTMSKTPNYALQIIDTAIARDIDAQKAELGKKENALSQYLAETKDLNAAAHMAREDAYNVAAQQIKTAGERGAANLSPLVHEQMYNEMLSKSIKEGFEAERIRVSNENESITRQTQVREFNAKEQGEAIKEKIKLLTSKKAQQAGSTVYVPKVLNINEGNDQRPFAPAKTAEGIVLQPRVAMDEKLTDKAMEAYKTNAEFMAGLANLKQQQEKLGLKGTLPFSSWKQTVNTFKVASQMGFLPKEEDLKRLNEEERKMVAEAYGHPDEFFSSATGRSKAALDALWKVGQTQREIADLTYRMPGTY